MEPTIVWYAQSSVRINVGDLVIYVDPYHLPDAQPPADVLLITHHHADHFSPEDIERVRTDSTVVFANQTVAGQLDDSVQPMLPGDATTHQNLSIRALPAYNVDKFRSPGVPYHPREENHLSFLLEIDDLSFYLASDTDVTPEMEEIGPVDYAFLPVSGTTVMTAEEAAEAARIIRPSVAVPVHYGGRLGTIEDARRFASLVPDQVRVWIMTPEGTP